MRNTFSPIGFTWVFGGYIGRKTIGTLIARWGIVPCAQGEALVVHKTHKTNTAVSIGTDLIDIPIIGEHKENPVISCTGILVEQVGIDSTGNRVHRGIKNGHIPSPDGITVVIMAGPIRIGPATDSFGPETIGAPGRNEP